MDKIDKIKIAGQGIFGEYEQLTALELIKRILEKINEIVDDTNTYTDIVNELRNWFNNLDVSEEVNNKLDEMEADGTLAEIINVTIFNKKVDKDTLFTSVKQYGAVGNANYLNPSDGLYYEDSLFTISATDDTIAIQRCINENQYVKFDKGNYLTTSDINLRSNTIVDFTGAKIIRNKNENIGYKIINATLIENVTLIKPYLVGDKPVHIGSAGQWGHGLNISSCRNITVYDLTARDCFGDGCYIGRSGDSYIPEGIYLLGNTQMFNCRRQGISIVNGLDILINSLYVDGVAGSPPGAGIDFEPNNIDEFIECTVNDLTVKNATYGILSIILSTRVNINIKNAELINCQTPVNIRVDAIGESVSHKSIKINNLTINGVSNTNPIRLENILRGYSPLIIFDSITVDNWIIDSSSSQDSWTGVIRNTINRTSEKGSEYGGVYVNNINILHATSNKGIRSFINSTSIASNLVSVKDIIIKSVDSFVEMSEAVINIKAVNCLLSSPNIKVYGKGKEGNILTEGFNYRGYSLSSGRLLISDVFKLAYLYTNEPFINLTFSVGAALKNVTINDVLQTVTGGQLTLNGTKNKIIVFQNIGNDIFINYETKDSGAFNQRPVVTNQIGYMYFNTDIGKAIWWNGTNWVDSTGTVIQ